VRSSDRALIASGMETREAAEAELRDHLRAVKR